jgi:hypothetical protein
MHGLHLSSDNQSYPTNFGNPRYDGETSYPAIKVSVEIARDGWGLFLKLFMGIYVAYAISLMVFFMGPDNSERYGLTVGALFAGIANKYIVDGLMPSNIVHTLPDNIHNITFVFIILHLVITVVANRLAAMERIDFGWKIDRWAFILSVATYLAINMWLVSKAVG